MRPSLFIGSSWESRDIAYAAQENLEDVAVPIVWTQGLFRLSRPVLESLVEELNGIDFGLFVFAPDDVTKIRSAELQTTRDNVIFELGLFIGSLGQKRCFIIQPREVPDFHLPTDLLGFITANFEQPRRREWLQAALGPAYNRIRREIQEFEPSDDVASMILSNFSQHERQHLLNLAQGHTEGYQGQSSLRGELRRLRFVGFVQSLPNRLIADMRDGMEFDLADYVVLTKLGALLLDQSKSLRQ